MTHPLWGVLFVRMQAHRQAKFSNTTCCWLRSLSGSLLQASSRVISELPNKGRPSLDESKEKYSQKRRQGLPCLGKHFLFIPLCGLRKGRFRSLSGLFCRVPNVCFTQLGNQTGVFFCSDTDIKAKQLTTYFFLQTPVSTQNARHCILDIGNETEKVPTYLRCCPITVFHSKAQPD